MHWNFIFYFPNPAHLILITLSSTCALKGKKKQKKQKKNIPPESAIFNNDRAAA